MKKKMFTLVVAALTFILLISCEPDQSVDVSKVSEFNDEDIYIIDDDEKKDIHKVDFEKLKEFHKFIKDNNIDFYSACEDYIFVNIDGLDDKFMYYDTSFMEIIRGKKFLGANCIYVSSNYYTDDKIEFVEGSFEGTDSSAIPVTLGYDYRDIVYLNQKIPFLYTDKDGSYSIKYLEVCGFTKANSSIVTDVHIDNEVKLAKNIIIQEEYYDKVNGFNNDEEKINNKSYYYTDGYYNFKDENEKNTVEKYSKDRELGFRFEKIDDNSKVNIYN